MSNILRLGDPVTVDPWWPQGPYEDTTWPGRVKALGPQLVLVDPDGTWCVDQSALWFPYGAVTRR